MKLENRINRCITDHHYNIENLFITMGKSYKLDSHHDMYLNCKTKIGIKNYNKNGDTLYVLAGTLCQMVIVYSDQGDSDYNDDFGFLNDTVNGEIYYIVNVNDDDMNVINKANNNVVDDELPQILCDEILSMKDRNKEYIPHIPYYYDLRSEEEEEEEES